MSEEASFAAPPTARREPGVAMKAHPARVISETIDVDADTAYGYVCIMDNLPHWASGLATGVVHERDGWYADSPMGRIRIDMAPRNAFGVVDHDVTLANGQRFHNAMRITPSGHGCVVAFVLLRMPDVTDEAFESDAAHVARDLMTLKALLEKQAG